MLYNNIFVSRRYIKIYGCHRHSKGRVRVPEKAKIDAFRCQRVYVVAIVDVRGQTLGKLNCATEVS